MTKRELLRRIENLEAENCELRQRVSALEAQGIATKPWWECPSCDVTWVSPTDSGTRPIEIWRSSHIRSEGVAA